MSCACRLTQKQNSWENKMKPFFLFVTGFLAKWNRIRAKWNRFLYKWNRITRNGTGIHANKCNRIADFVEYNGNGNDYNFWKSLSGSVHSLLEMKPKNMHSKRLQNVSKNGFINLKNWCLVYVDSPKWTFQINTNSTWFDNRNKQTNCLRCLQRPIFLEM